MKIENLLSKHFDIFFKDSSQKKLAVAVSGGVDSLCLAHLTHQWCQLNQYEMVALTVDHGLRQESKKEALQVQEWMKEKETSHTILTWTPPKQLKNLQSQARQARYNLLLQWCRKNDIPDLLLGHTLDDQYETVVMRLAHHSGPLGLAGIPIIREDQGVRLIRPLLNISKKQLTQQMKSWGIPWIEDPSNQRDIFTRVKVRKNRNSLEEKGLSQEKIKTLQLKMGLLRQTWEEESLRWIKDNVQFFPEGYVEINYSPFLGLPTEMQELIFLSLLNYVSGKTYSPRHSSLTLSLNKVNASKAHNCHGCLIERKGHNLYIYREESQISELNIGNQEAIWDNRFLIIPLESHLNSTLTVKPLGDSWVQLKEKTDIQKYPLAVRRTIPSVWEKEKLILVPHLGYDTTQSRRPLFKVHFFLKLSLSCARFIID